MNLINKRKSAPKCAISLDIFGVADGARTHDNRNHNPGAQSSIGAACGRVRGNFRAKTSLVFSRLASALIPRVSGVFLALLLAACGGGGSDIPVSTEAPSGIVQIAAYGDSTQAFHGNPHASSRDGWTIENKGVSGSSTSEWYSRWPAEMAATKASIVIYNGGLNDGGMSVDQYKATLREMIRITRAFGKQFILEQPNNADVSGDINLPTFIERRAAVALVASSEGVYYCAQPDVPLRDGIHPTDAGYATKATRLAECIGGILK